MARYANLSAAKFYSLEIRTLAELDYRECCHHILERFAPHQLIAPSSARFFVMLIGCGVLILIHSSHLLPISRSIRDSPRSVAVGKHMF